MAHCTSKKVLSGGFPSSVYHPRNPNEGNWEVRSGDGHETKEGYWRGRVTPGPEINWDKSER